MIGFASIAAVAPSQVGAMTDHLMNNTLRPELTVLANYYTRGVTPEQGPMVDLARAVAEQTMLYSEALDTLMASYVAEGGDLDLLDAAEERMGKRLADLAWHMQEGTLDAALAMVRPDIHPLAMSGLGIAPDGLLARDEINALLVGRRTDGERIAGKFYATERRLPANPRTGERRWSQPIGSYDFTPSPHKSVSVAWAFANPYEQGLIYSAHIEAAREAMRYVASEIGVARRGDGGSKGDEPGHIGWLEFTHHTARRVQIARDESGNLTVTRTDVAPGDPDLHTHFLIPNAVFCDSGHVGSLDTMAIRGFIKEADRYYHARLADRLRGAGFAVEADERTHSARMPVIPRPIEDLFSKRHNAGEAAARTASEDAGEVWAELSAAERARRVAVATHGLAQRVKGGKDDVADVEGWRSQAQAAGWEAPASLQLYGPPVPRLEAAERHRRAYEIGLPVLAERLERSAVIPHWDLRMAALYGMIETGLDGLEDIKGVTRLMVDEGVMQNGERTEILYGQEEGLRFTSVTTGLHQREEAEFIALARAAADDASGAIPRAVLAPALADSGLDFSGAHGQAQRQAIERVAASGRLGVIIAAAGAGKTAALKPLTAAWAVQGREVHGASLAWRQADDLAEAGIKPSQVKAFSVLLDSLEGGQTVLTPRAVVVVDELATLGTRQTLRLLRLQAAQGFSIVALGDDKQTPSIEAGATIDLMRRALGAERVPEIVTTRRQRSQREQAIVKLFRDGRAAEALAMKRSDGTAVLAYGGYDSTVEQVAKLYAGRLAAGVVPTISAPTNGDAQAIGVAVRVERRRAGLLAADALTVPATDGRRESPLALAPGDWVRLHKSTRARYETGRTGPIGRNGGVLVVKAIEPGGLVLQARSGRTGFVPWTQLRSGERVLLSYGYAQTIHTAQGSTAGEHIFALPGGSQAINGALGYTAATRHTQTSYLVTNEQAERIEVRQNRPVNDPHEISADDTWANVARHMAFQPEQDSATALLERVRDMRAGSVRGFQAAIRPAGQQQTGPAVVLRQRTARALAGEIQALTASVARSVERVRTVAREVRVAWQLRH